MSNDLTEKEYGDEIFTILGGGIDRNGNESADSYIASADYRQLIDSETVLVSKMIGDRLIIVRCGGHCGACDCGFG